MKQIRHALLAGTTRLLRSSPEDRGSQGAAVNTVRSALVVAAITAFCGVAKADTISASLFSPLAPTGVTRIIIELSSISPPSQASLKGTGYSIDFSDVGGDEGIVQSTLVGRHAVPVAAAVGMTPEYLTGGFASGLTTHIAASGNYFSTGLGTITIRFSTPQRSLALLWGSIDRGNSLTFNDAARFVVTGSEVQTAAAGFVSNGFQGPGGSAYVVVDTSTPFTTVTAASTQISFEFAGVAAANAHFTFIPQQGYLLRPRPNN
jgi:hypothetical protein